MVVYGDAGAFLEKVRAAGLHFKQANGRASSVNHTSITLAGMARAWLAGGPT